MKKRTKRRGIQFLSLFFSFFFIVSISESIESLSPFESLILRLEQDGFDSQFLSDLLTDTRAELNPLSMTISLEKRETKELYAQFLTQDSVLLSQQFLHQNMALLRKAEDRFRVDKEVVVAILRVESKFGENIGKFRVIPTLASMALMDSPDYLQTSYLILREKDPQVSYETIEVLAKRRAEWAYRELKCFLNIIYKEKIDPLEVYGSYAGALGMAQFVPSSYLSYAMSQKNFEDWLLSKEAAIFSIGNYLRSHGWKKNLTIEQKKKVLWTYNRSQPYVDTILQLAQKIKGR